MRWRCHLVWLLLLAVLTTGCAGDAARLGAHLRAGEGPSRIALMPMDIGLSRVSAGGFHQPVASWTEAAEQHLVQALRQVARERGLILLQVEPELWQKPAAHQSRLLQGAIQQAILLHHFGDDRNRLPSKNGHLGWSMGASGRDLRPVLAADYGLFIHLRDSYSSTGRRVLSVVSTVLVGLPLRGGQQVGIATLVDLRSGQVVWARALDRGTGDLRDPKSALETAQALLKELPQ